MIAFLLHIANRNIRNRFVDECITEFYRIKDIILKQYAHEDGYDIQKISGLRCNRCDGYGNYHLYSYHTGKRYDTVDCYHCFGGYYRLPKWICLQRYSFGKYTFHKPLKRHECVQNPFTEEELGWKVTDRSIINDYIDHQSHPWGDVAVMLFFLRYNPNLFWKKFKEVLYWRRVLIKNKFKNMFRWSSWLVAKPKISINYYSDENFTEEDLPF